MREIHIKDSKFNILTIALKDIWSDDHEHPHVRREREHIRTFISLTTMVVFFIFFCVLSLVGLYSFVSKHIDFEKHNILGFIVGLLFVVIFVLSIHFVIDGYCMDIAKSKEYKYNESTIKKLKRTNQLLLLIKVLMVLIPTSIIFFLIGYYWE